MIGLLKKLRLYFFLLCFPIICVIVMISSFLSARRLVPRQPQNFNIELTGIAENLSKPIFEYFRKKELHLVPWFLDHLRDNDTGQIPSTFSILAKTICSRKAYTLLIMVPATIAGKGDREFIRQTWARSVYYGMEREYQTQNIRLAFFFGDELLKSHEKYQLQLESSVYNDIVVANFQDTYRNLSLKMATSISWAAKYCSEAQFIMKVDQDVYLNLDLLLYILNRFPKPELDFTLGFRHLFNPPRVERNGKWGNSVFDYPFNYYPSYVVGYAYVLSRLAVRKLTENFHRFHFFANEDALINGVMSLCLNITRIHSNAFSIPAYPYQYCDVVYNKYVSFVVNYDKLPSLWKSIHSKNCSTRKVL